jgi:predicted GNAT family N-acyltransferase
MAWESAREAARPIRVAVFVEEQGVPLALEWDEHDAVSEHAIARDREGRAVGTGRLLPDGHIGRMAVLRDARGQGVGSALLQALVHRAEVRGLGCAMLNAQTHAVPFYSRHGFEAMGEPFLEAGIPHVRMRRTLGGESPQTVRWRRDGTGARRR